MAFGYKIIAYKERRGNESIMRIIAKIQIV
jgi:hypothetical protein